MDDFSYSTLLEYERLKGADQNLRARAQLYSEIAHANYLVWALQFGTADEVADAERFLEDLAIDIEAGLIAPIGPKPLGTDAVLTNVTDSGLGTAAGFVDAGQALVSDDMLLTPVDYNRDSDPAAVDPSSANLFKPVVDSSYDHKNLFGDTAPIPVFSDDATAPIPVFSDDSTAPITLPNLAEVDEAGADEAAVEIESQDADSEDAAGEPKNGELF
jgi:hypothetical protein